MQCLGQQSNSVIFIKEGEEGEGEGEEEEEKEEEDGLTGY